MSSKSRAIVRVDRDAMAVALHLTPRRVNQLADAGHVKRLDRGEYDLYASLTGYILFLHEAMRTKSTMDERGNVTSSKDQRARLMEIEIAKAEIDLAKARGQVMAVDDHRLMFASYVLETKARMMPIGARASAKITTAMSRSDRKKAIDKEVIAALVERSLSPTDIPDGPTAADPAAAVSKKAAKKAAKNAVKKSAKKKSPRVSKPPTT